MEPQPKTLMSHPLETSLQADAVAQVDASGTLEAIPCLEITLWLS